MKVVITRMSEISSSSSINRRPKARTKIGQWFMDLWSAILKFLNKQFTGIFERSKIFFTLIFLGGAIVIAFLALGKSNGFKNATNILTLIFVLGFLFLMICAFIRVLAKHLFAEEGWFTKILITVMAFALSIIITLLWFHFGEDSVTIPFFKFSQLLPYIFIITFLGWNILQIHFIKDGINSVSVKVENRLINGQVDSKKKNITAISMLVISLIVPLIAHVFTVWAFWADAQALTDPNATAKFIAWVVIIGLLFLGLDGWQVWLFVKSNKFHAANVYSNFFYLLISLVIWFRTYGFITSFVIAISTTGTNVFNAFGNILLVILTAIFVLKMIASRIKKTNKLNEDAIPFLVFTLTIMYIAGQVVLIIGSVSTNNVNIANNSILLISSVFYYLWYSQFILQRKGYIKRNLFTIEEVKGVMNKFADEMKVKSPHDSEKIDKTLAILLDEQKIEESDAK